MSSETPAVSAAAPSYLGDWTAPSRVAELRKEFINAKPFEHVSIPGFFSPSMYDELRKRFPTLESSSWFRYWNPIEKKYALNNFTAHPEFGQLFQFLQSPEFVSLVRQITGIDNLENDPHLHGAGLHYHDKGGKLDMHLDYSVHPISGKERRVNLIIYFNDDWKEDWGGHLQLWDSAFTKCEQSILPGKNTAVLFRTSDISYHGLPKPIQCPPGKGRKSVAIYYVSDPRPDVTIRYKAQFRPLPDQKVNEKLAKLYEIRATRVITKDELEQIYPGWEEDGNGHW